MTLLLATYTSDVEVLVDIVRHNIRVIDAYVYIICTATFAFFVSFSLYCQLHVLLSHRRVIRNSLLQLKIGDFSIHASICCIFLFVPLPAGLTCL